MKVAWMLAGLLLIATAAQAAEPAVGYVRDIKPILKERCLACHGALKQKGGLRLDTAAAMRTGGDGGEAVVSGDPLNSLLIERLIDPEPASRMPPEGHPLTAEQIDKIKAWIQQGLKAPENEKPELDPREHWAFKQPVKAALPKLSATGTPPHNPIDAFIQAQQQTLAVTPLPAADKATLLRRVYLDLIGLPPTADEVRDFLNDTSPAAYEQVVERLLASPQHGERWARHWMDVWRYSDWYGRRTVPDVMNSYPMVWRWRDWIIRSLNEDKGYDRMVVEMLAADEVAPTDDANLVATGYLVRSWFKWNYEVWKKDLVEHTGKAFLGITLNCCQCHDHKYDPFRQEEYFQFRAFFEPLELRHDRVAGEPDPGPFEKYIYTKSYGPIKSGMVRVFDEQLNAETFMFAKGDSRLRMEGKPPVSFAAPAVVGGNNISAATFSLPVAAAYPGLKPFVQNEERATRQSRLTAAQSTLEQVRMKYDPNVPAALTAELQAAESALVAAKEAALAGNSSGMSPVLAGSQSLVLDARAGRRALSHPLLGLDDLAANSTLSYLLQITQDDHTNLQLGLDIAQGATGGWVGFEKGSIKSYAPGGFQEVVIGKYDLAGGQNRFKVVMQLDLPQNQFLLTVTSLVDNKKLVDNAPAALNGWQPRPNGKRGLFIDCRPGTQAIYDDVTFALPDGKAVLTFDFESPTYLDGHDVVEAGGWANTGSSAAPATSLVASVSSLNPQVQAALARRAAAQQAVQSPRLGLVAAEDQVAAAQLELVSLERRITADMSRYASGLLQEDRQADPAVRSLIHAACQSEREAAVANAKAAVSAGEYAVATVTAKVTAATEKAATDAANKELQTAMQQLGRSTQALQAANAAMAPPLGEYTPLSPKYPGQSSGRRTALARWITDRQNPLAARVAVNHLWLRHFGQAFVATTHDLGRNGSPPTHPELLDWLACELMESGWSMKHMHRLIVTSETYQLASVLPASSASGAEAVAGALKIDPENRAYWHFPANRMQAEVVRDSLLDVTGELDATMGGHELDHHLGLTSKRRSLYFSHHGEEKMEFLELFDAANPGDCYRRTSSIQPQQALALTNSELTRTLSRQLASRLWVRASNPAVPQADPVKEFVSLAFLQVLNREPRPAEFTASVAFLQEQATRLTTPGAAAANVDPVVRARENLVHALMNHNDFLTIR
ncbi:MAG: PSD1 and planctomycete cytochrome C domain-containing protein [Planctomycetota bacterium]